MLQNYQIENSKKRMVLVGAISTAVVIIGIILDIIIGSSTGGNLTTLPLSAVERFNQLHTNVFLGLYNLDLLNVINQILLVPTYFSLYIVLKEKAPYSTLFAMILFLVGTVIFVSNNTAFTMLDLRQKYFSTTTDSLKILYSAAGEAMLAKGAHGSFSALIGFLIPNIAGIILSSIMLKTNIFSKTTGYLGFFGSILISVYIIIVTFVPNVKSMATAFAALPGLMLLIWMVLFMIRLFKIAGAKQVD